MSNGTFATVEISAYRYQIDIRYEEPQQIIDIRVEPMAGSAESTATYTYRPSKAWGDTRIFQEVCSLVQQLKAFPLP